MLDTYTSDSETVFVTVLKDMEFRKRSFSENEISAATRVQLLVTPVARFLNDLFIS